MLALDDSALQDRTMADITLISGSTLGSAEYVAEHLADKLEEAGFSTETLHGPTLDKLSLQGLWLIVSSTHGAGELPDNLQPLYEALEQQRPDLSDLRFGAVGIGNREYDLFCGAIKQFEQLMVSLGAKRIGERLEIDVLEHEIPEDPAEVWLENWRSLL
ncbi:FMN-binding protein MioC [Mixta theicola]|nr:FMN-binding protein MioC [Mixta theicola]